jgi:glycosyltransferase involved in cell wall biosynthesis
VLITVAICTRNRPDSLRRTLEALTRLEFAEPPEWELLVVDNAPSNSTTQPVVESFGDRLPVRLVAEHRVGHAAARNRAIAEARGEYLVMTDDDVLADPRWLDAYSRAFREWPEAGFFSGPIDPLFLDAPPEWLTRTLEIDGVGSAFGRLRLGAEPRELRSEAEIFGGNMGFRTSGLRRYTFDPALGRSGAAVGRDRIGGGETRVVARMLDAGLRGRWVPDARVQHCVDGTQMTLAFVRRAARGYGIYVGRQRRLENRRGTLLAKWLFRGLAEEARYLVLRRLSGPERWIPHMLAASRFRGQIRGYRTTVSAPRR